MKTFSLLTLACFALGCSQPATKADSIASSTSPVPEADVIDDKTCVDTVWLLTHYDVTRLASGSAPAEGTGYPLACCADGVLKPEDSYRCEIDWPSSDVISCEVWAEYHDALAAAHPEGTRSPRVIANLEALKRWPSERHHCMSPPEALSGTEMATERRTLTLFPRDLSYDEAKGVVIFAPDSGVKRAAYVTYTLTMESFKRALPQRPQAPVEVIVELKSVTHKTERAAPGSAEPDGGFQNTYYEGTVVGLP